MPISRTNESQRQVKALTALELSQLEEPWVAVDDGGNDLVAELRAETTLGHCLYNRSSIEAIARHRVFDDVLFLVDGIFARVHLTWRKSEPGPLWPSTELYSSWAEFIANGMNEDKSNLHDTT